MFFSKGEGFVRSIMLLHALFTGLIYFEEERVLTLSFEGYAIRNEIVFLRNHLPAENFYL